MGIIVKKFTEDHIDRAVDIFSKIYSWEREVSPLLPPHPLTEPDRIGNALRLLIQTGPGISLFEDDRMIAYMITGDRFDCKGQKAVMIPEYAHGAEIDMDLAWEPIYRQMYKELAAQWLKEGIHLHFIGFMAHDQELKDILFQLGFGGYLTERIRDLSDIMTVGGSFSIEPSDEPEELYELRKDQYAGFESSPIFMKKKPCREALVRDLQKFNDEGDALFVYRSDNGIGAYMAVGESVGQGEGFLLRNTRTAQIKSAYVKPDLRNQGIGLNLLKKSIQWAREEGFDALFVEHETANSEGSAFWGKHFDPYVHFAMRYIDNTL
ncbi:MAG: GNAT family N-acetyltransferase [Spirochaetales bacterium]|nr:GNAT family N-acetyltransferase [Spirochaetales bacterium]